jgi:hypothetical protein
MIYFICRQQHITAVFINENETFSFDQTEFPWYCKIADMFLSPNTAKILLQGICFCKRHICWHLVDLFSGLIALWYLPELQGTILLEGQTIYIIVPRSLFPSVIITVGNILFLLFFWGFKSNPSWSKSSNLIPWNLPSNR